MKIRKIQQNPKRSHLITQYIRQQFLVIGGVLIMLGIVILICYLCYRRYITRQMYNDTPESLSKKPNHTLGQMIKLANEEFKSFREERVNVLTKQLHEGKVYQLTFQNGIGGMYFSNILTQNCYFEVEILRQHSLIQIGFFNQEDLQQVLKGEHIHRFATLISNYGTVTSHGRRLYSYELSLKYGDTLGIGITKYGEQRRVWVSHNGALLNKPSPEQVDNWIADANFDPDEKQQYQKNEYEEKNKNEPHNQELIKRKITLNSTKQFKYYGVIVSSEGKIGKHSMINVNVGGQVFRLHEKIFSAGLIG